MTGSPSPLGRGGWGVRARSDAIVRSSQRKVKFPSTHFFCQSNINMKYTLNNSR